MNTPHKHAALIKAWADGAEVQWHSPNTDVWYDVDNPTWYDGDQYRIKSKWQNERDALAEGKVVERRVNTSSQQGVWYPIQSIVDYEDDSYEYRIKPHKWQHIIDAHRAGKQVQYRIPPIVEWFVASSPTFSEDLEWRIQPTHKYQEVIDAHKAGKKVQYRYTPEGVWWEAGDSPSFRENIEWRIAPKVIVKKYRIQYQPKDNWSGFLDGPVENLELTFEDDGSRVAKLVNAQVLE